MLDQIKCFLHRGADIGLVGLFAIVTLTLVGNLSASIKPILLSSYVGLFGFPVDSASYILTAELVATSVAATVFTVLPRAMELRKLCLAATVVVLFGHGVSVLASDFTSLMIIRALTGIGQGLLLSAGAAAITRVSEPARLAGAITIVTCTVGAALIFGMPNLQAAFGPQAVFWTLMAITVAGGCIILRLPSMRLGMSNAVQAGVSRQQSNALGFDALVVLGVVAVYYLGVGSFWPFAAEIGIAAGISYAGVAEILGYATVASVLGALVCMLSAGRVTRRATFSLALGLPPLCLVVMNLLPQSYTAYAVAMIAYQFCWFLFFPSLMGLASEVDPSGRVNSLIYVFGAVGFAIGPAIGGYLATFGAMPGEANLQPVKLLGMATFLPAFAILITVLRMESSGSMRSESQLDSMRCNS